MLTRRTLINLAAVGLASAVLILYGLTQLVVGAVFDPSYPLYVELPAAEGLVEDKEVSYNGVGIGQVEALELTEDRVRVEMAIDEGVEVPATTDVVVMRSSPIGEQRLELRPHAEGGDVLEPGDEIQPREITMPTRVQPLLELAADVFEPVDPETAGDLVGELADATRGRRDDVRAFLRDSARFSETVADHGEDYDRFFAASRRVNAALADSRETLGRLLGEITAATEILTAARSDYEALLASAPPVLAQTGDVVERSQPNLSCSLRDLAALTAFMAEDEQLANAAEALRLNQWFFEGFNTIAPQDARGNWWQRIHFVVEPAPPPRSYLPEKRPIPATLPGGACSSPFGEGAPAATQADFELAVPDGRVIPPEDDRAEPVRRTPRAADDDRSDAGAADERDADDGRVARREAEDREPRPGADAPDEPSEPSGLADSGLALAALVLGALGVAAAGAGALRVTVRSRKED